MVTIKVRRFVVGLLFCLYAAVNLAWAETLDTHLAGGDSGIPSIALLEFLGNTAGLESLGIDLDLLLASAQSTENTREREDESED